MLRLIRRFGKRAALGIKEEAARREQLKKEHIDTAKEYAQAVKQATSQTANDVKNIITGKEGTTATKDEEAKHDPARDVPPESVNAYEVKDAVKETLQAGMKTIKGAAQAIGEAMDPYKVEKSKSEDKNHSLDNDSELTKELKDKGTEVKEREDSGGYDK